MQQVLLIQRYSHLAHIRWKREVRKMKLGDRHSRCTPCPQMLVLRAHGVVNGKVIIKCSSRGQLHAGRSSHPN